MLTGTLSIHVHQDRNDLSVRYCFSFFLYLVKPLIVFKLLKTLRTSVDRAKLDIRTLEKYQTYTEHCQLCVYYY